MVTTTDTTATTVREFNEVQIDAGKLAAVKKHLPAGMSLEEHLSAILMRWITKVEK